MSDIRGQLRHYEGGGLVKQTHRVIHAPTGDPKDIDIFREGRKCRKCKKILSRYNPEKTCFVCYKQIVWAELFGTT